MEQEAAVWRRELERQRGAAAETAAAGIPDGR
jgi:hypothetical protein